MITEYGADAVAGIHQCVPEMFSEEYQMEYYRRQNEEFDKGLSLWESRSGILRTLRHFRVA